MTVGKHWEATQFIKTKVRFTHAKQKIQHCSETEVKQSDSILSVYYLQLLKILQLLTRNVGLSAYLSACSISDNVTVCSFGY